MNNVNYRTELIDTPVHALKKGWPDKCHTLFITVNGEELEVEDTIYRHARAAHIEAQKILAKVNS